MCVNKNKKVFMDFLCAKRKYFYLCAVIIKANVKPNIHSNETYHRIYENARGR